MAKMKIKKNDLVQVIAGKDKGLQGRVIAVHKETDRVVVEGVNRITKHTRASGQSGVNTGGIQVLLNAVPTSREAAGANSSVLLVPIAQVERIEVERGARLERQQLGIARTRAHEVDGTHGAARPGEGDRVLPEPAAQL